MDQNQGHQVDTHRPADRRMTHADVLNICMSQKIYEPFF